MTTPTTPADAPLTPAATVVARYTTDEPRGRSRARPVHLVRQALGVPHFGIAPGAVAPVKKSLPLPPPPPILSSLPESGVQVYVDDDDDPPRLIPSLDDRPRVYYTHARLPHLSPQARRLWESLHHFRPRVPEYARLFREVADSFAAPPHGDLGGDVDAEPPCPGFTSRNTTYLPAIQEAFNWSALRLPPADEGRYYGVLFRSTRAPDCPSTRTETLYAADRRAHEEAVASGGLVMYWYGVPDGRGDNVATCVWTGREEARVAGRGVMHRLAAGLAASVYERYELVRYCVEKRRGEEGLRVGPWDE